MGNYIERQAALHAVNEFFHDPKVDIALNAVPAANVREYVRVEWKPTEYPIMPECEDCSVCGYRAVYGHNYKFCPNCGAQMDGGVANEH